MRRYVLGRVALAPVFLFVILTTLFVLLRVLPGDPVTVALGGRLSPAQIASRRAASGLDQPLWVQYWEYLTGVARGDFGRAVTDPRPVGRIVADLFPATFELVLFGMVVAVVIGFVFGALAARFRDTPLDAGSRLLGIVLYAAPVFWTGILAQLFFANRLGWLPTGNRIGARMPVGEVKLTGFYLLDGVLRGNWAFFWDALRHLLLPGLTLGLVIAGVFIRMVRVNMLQTLRADYVEAARARGISERRVVFRHALRNALVPVVTMIGLQLAVLLAGAILTETTFSWPGLSSALVRFLNNRDYAAVQGIVTFIAVLVVGISLLIDLVNALIDPRVRY